MRADIFSRGVDEVSIHSRTGSRHDARPQARDGLRDSTRQQHAEAEEAVEHLEKHKRYLRGLLAKRVSMKFMPELRFKVDATFEASARIELLASPKVARDLDG